MSTLPLQCLDKTGGERSHMATEAKPGKAIVLKLREDEEQLVIDWINKQTMYSDSIRYLIQKEIAENGLRNLQLFVPRIRTIDTIKSQLKQSYVEQPKTEAPVPTEHRIESEAVHEPDPNAAASASTGGLSETSHLTSEQKQLNPDPIQESRSAPEQQNEKKRAGKKFGSDVIQSFMN